jgi:glycosyltransferase involved in cell wall biosynthesis
MTAHPTKQLGTPRKKNRLNKTIVFTIVSNNYFAYAATLMNSVARSMSDSRRIIFICDELTNYDVPCSAEIYSVSRPVGNALFDMVIRYSILEINTAVKPYIILNLLDQGIERIIYLDPDIYVFESLDAVVNSLREGHDLVLTPHITGPLSDDKHPDDHEIMSSGVWNLGFAAFRRSDDVYKLVRWWRDKCASKCLADPSANMFTDQRWMDMGPAFVEKTKLLHHPGYNAAYWNLSQRKISRNSAGKWVVNDSYPLCFFHFSGVVPSNAGVISKHQNRFVASDLPSLRDLFDEYRAEIRSNGWQRTNHLPYAWGKSREGRVVPDIARHLFRQLHPTSIAHSFNDVAGALTWFCDWFDQPAHESNPCVTRLMASIYERRPDLQQAFNLSSPKATSEFHEWFQKNGAVECKVDEQSLAAARELAITRGVVGSSRPAARIATWRTFLKKLEAELFAPRCELPPTNQLLDWLHRTIDLSELGLAIHIPIGFLLPLISRVDLQDAFPLVSRSIIFDYFYWLFTHGSKEGYWSAHLSDALFSSVDPEIRAFDTNAPPNASLKAGLSTFVIMAMAKYDGRFGFADVDPWKYPEALSARLTYAYLHEFREAAFPFEVTNTVTKWLWQPVKTVQESYGIFIPRFLHTLWNGRPDLKTQFAGNSATSWLGFLGWFLTAGQSEYSSSDHLANNVSITELLSQDWNECYPLKKIHAAIYYSRRDLQSLMNISTEDGKRAFKLWIRESGRKECAAVLAIAPRTSPTLKDTVTQLRKKNSTPKTKSIVVIGHFSAPSGRGEDARTLCNSLSAAGFHVLKVDRSGDPERLDLEESGVFIHVLNADTALQDYVWSSRLRTSAVKNIGYWAWELDKLPSAWRHSFAFYDEIWANSTFCAKAFQYQRLRPVKTLPLAVAPLDKKASIMPIEVDPRAFCFFFSFDFTSYVERKNPDAVVCAFLNAFPTGNEPVQLLIKTIGGDARPEALSSLLALCEGDHRIIIVDGELTREELNGLFFRADAYVSLHRAEGFGRGIAEAMLAQKPVVVTDYSGSSDFCNADNSYSVRYELTKIKPGEYVPASTGFDWANPDIDHASAQMLSVFQDRQKAKRVAERGRSKISSDFSIEAIAGRLKTLLQMADLGPSTGLTRGSVYRIRPASYLVRDEV